MADAPLRDFIERHPRLFVLTGAGCSTASGIPDYRDGNGDWKRARPMRLQGAAAFAAKNQGPRDCMPSCFSWFPAWRIS